MERYTQSEQRRQNLGDSQGLLITVTRVTVLWLNTDTTTATKGTTKGMLATCYAVSVQEVSE